MFEGVEGSRTSFRRPLDPRDATSLSTSPLAHQRLKDGVTVAKNIEFSDRYQNMGLLLFVR